MCFGVLALCLMASPSNFPIAGKAAHPKQASLPPAFPPGTASTSSCRDNSRGPLAGPEPSPVFGCHVLNSKGKMPGGGSERDWADTELSLQ